MLKLLHLLALSMPLLMSQSGAAAGKTRPSQILKGKRFQLEIIDGSFTLPKGWVATETRDGTHLSHSRFTASNITLGAIWLTPEQKAMRIDALVQQEADNALGQLRMKQLRAPKPSRVRSNPMSHLILEGPIDGVTYRARVGAIGLGSQLMLFIAVYPAADEASIGPVFHTTMVSFRGKKAQERTAGPQASSPTQNTHAKGASSKINSKLTKKLLGCWRYRTSTGGSTGSSNTTKRFYFDTAGNYTYSYRTYVSTPYGSSKDGDDDDGRYLVVGTMIDFKSNQGTAQDVSTSVRVNQGFLFVGNTRYIRCE